MTTEIFSDDQSQQQQQQDAVGTTTAAPESKPAFNIPTEVNELVGEGKKYKSVEDALRSVPHAQKHISTLEVELAQAREELAKRRAAEDLLNEIKQASIPQQQTTGSVEADPEVLSQIVEQVLEKKTAQQTAQQNAKSVVEKFTAVYGDKAKDMYIKLAADSGLSEQALDNLSRTSPSAVLKLAGIDSNTIKSVGKLGSDVNTTSLQQTPQEKSSRVPAGATSKDMAAAMRAAREHVLNQYK